VAGLTREFKEIVARRAERDPEFRREMLKTGVELLLTGNLEDAAIGREKLRTYINATIGFESLAAELDKSPKSLMRMLSASGNPSLRNLSAVVGALQRVEGVRLEVREAS
jgi:DNA-binding phage protein